MILLLILSVFVNSKIPKQFKELVNEALNTTQQKIPKELRENTKYPGEYKGSNYHFKLLKTFTSINTNDIKGFATDGSFCAIIKRKQYNLKDNFIFFEPKSQNFYRINHVIASDGNILIYESTQTNIFDVITNFELHTNTETNLRSPKGINNPNTIFDVPVKWNKKENRPEMEKIKETEIEIGLGANSRISMDTTLRFNNIFDVKIATSIRLESYIGCEFLIPDDTEIEIQDYQFYEYSVVIPRLNITMEFMGIKINLVFNFNFDVELTDTSIQIPVGFDFFKGYKMIASKYFELSKYSKINPDWNLELINLPEVNTINDVAKTITSSSFSAKFQAKPYFTLDVEIANINISLELGLQIPFIFDFNFDTEKCMYPYLTGMMTFPLQMFYHFSGLTLFDYIEIIEECSDEKILFQASFGPFCIGGSETFMEGSNSFIQDTLDTAYHITSTDFYEIRKE